MLSTKQYFIRQNIEEIQEGQIPGSGRSKILTKLHIKGVYLTIIKAVYDKPIAKYTQVGEEGVLASRRKVKTALWRCLSRATNRNEQLLYS
jgi:hypothetical protein